MADNMGLRPDGSEPSAYASRGQALRRYPRLACAEQPDALAAFGGTYCRCPAGLAAFSPTF